MRLTTAIGGTLIAIVCAGTLSSALPQGLAPGAGAMPQAPAGQTGSLTTLNASKPTARLRGRVVAADTGAPIPRATVRVRTGPARTLTAVAGNDGRWELAMPDTDEYLITITASAPGYVGLSLGQHTLRDRVRTVQIRDGEVIDRLDFALPGSASLVVDVTDDFGEPLENVTVLAERLAYREGRRQPMAASVAITDDQGTARLAVLEPDDYFVSATYAANDRTPRLDTSDSRQTLAHTYVPGTSELRNAQRVSLTPGSEQHVAVALVRTSIVTLSGQLVTADGGVPPRHQLALRAVSGSLMPGLGPAGNFAVSVPMTSDGTFAIANLVPGEYELIAWSTNEPSVVAPVSSGAARAAPVTPSNSPSDYAQLRVAVGDVDIDNLVVPLRPTPVLHGRIRFDTGQPPDNLRPQSVVFVPRQYFIGDTVGQLASRVNDDWSFTITGIAGTAALRLNTRGAGGWFIRQVTVDGRDMTDEPVSFADIASKTIDVLLTKQPSTISGVARDARGQVTSDYVAVLFPQDRRKWLPNSHIVDAATPDARGEFRFTEITPGDYYLIAIDRLENLQEEDPAILERLEPLATRFSLGDAENKIVPLKVTTF